MTAASHPLLLRRSYRSDAPNGSDFDRVVEAHLGDAADALNMAVLTLDGSPDESRASKRGRITHARKLLVEATTALSRARLHVPQIRTYSVPVVMNAESDPDLELSRLHQITTRLLWFNHEHLPTKAVAIPLTDEDERQLAEVLRELGRHSRINRAMRHKWLAGTLVCAALIPVLGPAVALAAIGCGAVAVVELTRGDAPQVAPELS